MDRFTLKPMSADAIPSAIAKAERYRLLNEPGEAESICLDILQIDPHNEDARVMLLLALTDQFPLDTVDRIPALREQHGVGYCNITRCCTKVCPEHITITENAIIPLKERVVDEFYDPVHKLLRVFRR